MELKGARKRVGVREKQISGGKGTVLNIDMSLKNLETKR